MKKKYRNKPALLCVSLLSLVICMLSACASESAGASEGTGISGQSDDEPVQREFFAMDTYMTFTAYGSGAEQALADAEEEIRTLEGEWSVTDEDSEIWQVNHSDGEPVVLSDDTARVVQFALDMAKETDGALEPTIYPVLTAWGFTTDENRIPAEDELQALLENVGYEKVELSGNEIRLQPGMELDLGAVGKGYAGDLAAERMEADGITSALLDIGGNIQAIGFRPDGADWRIGIRSPYGEGEIGVLSVSDCAVVTSGNYERYFVGEDGEEYGHIIDPATGYPVDNGLASVTIITEEGKRGDALSTSMFVKGLEQAQDYWSARQDFDMIMVTEDGQLWMTEGAAERFELSGDFANMEVHIITA